MGSRLPKFPVNVHQILKMPKFLTSLLSSQSLRESLSLAAAQCLSDVIEDLSVCFTVAVPNGLYGGDSIFGAMKQLESCGDQTFPICR